MRASGTIGGNLANGSPIGDLAPCLIALGAEIELRRGSELRRLPLEAFFIASIFVVASSAFALARSIC